MRMLIDQQSHPLLRVFFLFIASQSKQKFHPNYACPLLAITLVITYYYRKLNKTISVKQTQPTSLFESALVLLNPQTHKPNSMQQQPFAYFKI